MIGLLVSALLLMPVEPSDLEPAPIRLTGDPCVTLRGQGKVLVDGERRSGTLLRKTLRAKLAPTRPVFIELEGRRAASDVASLTQVLAIATEMGATGIVMVEKCPAPTEPIPPSVTR